MVGPADLMPPISNCHTGIAALTGDLASLSRTVDPHKLALEGQLTYRLGVASPPDVEALETDIHANQQAG
jgi:hypothetical protein